MAIAWLGGMVSNHAGGDVRRALRLPIPNLSMPCVRLRPHYARAHRAKADVLRARAVCALQTQRHAFAPEVHMHREEAVDLWGACVGCSKWG